MNGERETRGPLWVGSKGKIPGGGGESMRRSPRKLLGFNVSEATGIFLIGRFHKYMFLGIGILYIYVILSTNLIDMLRWIEFYKSNNFC